MEFILFENGWDHSVFKRRKELTEEELRSGKEVQRDEKLSKLLQSTQFLPDGDEGVMGKDEGATTFLFKDKRNRVEVISPLMEVSRMEPVVDDGKGRKLENEAEEQGPARKKPKKSVRFAD